MDENFGGQPNPLNPKPNMGPSPMDNSNPAVEPNMDQNMNQGVNVPPSPMQPNPEMNMGNMQDTSPIRPMERAPEPVPEPPKKKKTGLIAGIIAGVIILAGIIVAIILILNSGDPVSKAIEKIMKGEAPEKVAMDGVIDIKSNSEDIGALSAKIELKTQSVPSSLMNTTSANVTLDFKDLGSVSFNAEEIYPSNGDLYLKIDGFTTAMTDFNDMVEEYYNTVYTTNSATIDEITGGTTGEATEELKEDSVKALEKSESIDGRNDFSTMTDVDYLFDDLGGIFENLDGKWIKISLDNLNGFTSGSMSGSTDCSANLISDLKNSGNTIAQMYNKNSFISSTTENVTLTSKNSKVYQVVLDNEKLNNFASELNTANFANSYKDCTQSDENVFEATDISSLPNFYVELDDSYNFTRLYTSTTLDENGEFSLTADVNLTYPENINVSEPEDAVDFMEVMQMFLGGFLPNSEDITPSSMPGELHLTL